MSTSQSDKGEIKLDGFLSLYLGSPLACSGGSTYTVSKSFAATTRVSVTDGSGIQITSGTSSGFMAGGGSVTFGNSTTFTQTSSTQVSNGIVLQRTLSAQTQTPPPGNIGNSIFLGLYRPTIKLSGPPSGVVFKFLKADLEFVLKESSLVADLPVGNLFSQSTTRSFLDQYLPINDPTGTTLVKPRFKLKFAVLLDAGVPKIFTFSKSSSVSSQIQNTSTTSVSIVASSGFSLGLFKAAFSVGKTLSVQHVQSFESAVTKVITLSTALNRATRGISAVFYDRVFKTFVVVDQGQPGPTVVQGKVSDAQGNPIPGAAVVVIQNGTSYIAVADASGSYALAAPQAAPLSPGSAQVTSGGVSQIVSLGGGVARANLAGVNAAVATAMQFEDSTQ